MKKLIGTLVLGHALAAGSIIFTIAPPTAQSTPPGGISNTNCANGLLSCLIFSGTITPDSAADTFVNAIQLSFSPSASGLTNNSNFFSSNVPGFFAASDPVYSGFVFEVDIAFVIASGLYHGTATLVGGTSSPEDLNRLTSATFDVNVLGVPEPSVSWLFGLGLCGLIAVKVSRRA